jgi:hypothetical protein
MAIVKVTKRLVTDKQLDYILKLAERGNNPFSEKTEFDYLSIKFNVSDNPDDWTHEQISRMITKLKSLYQAAELDFCEDLYPCGGGWGDD